MWRRHAKRLNRLLQGQNRRLLVAARDRDEASHRLVRISEIASQSPYKGTGGDS